MNLQNRIDAFTLLGEKLKNLSPDEYEELVLKAQNSNSWFTEKSVAFSLSGIITFLKKDTLEKWINSYNLAPTPKKIGVVMAGNIPMVGFHDLLCVLISGNILKMKLSAKDEPLIKFICQILIDINSEFENYIFIEEQLKDVDAIIATGSDNSSRYFEYYFAKYPNIIRKNRTSIGILTGDEKKEDLALLGLDVFTYFGLGCRNVSKLYVPNNYEFDSFFQSIESFSYVGHHHKYNNNYEYNKSIYLINGEKHFDNGFLLLRKSDQMVSPISVLFYETYGSKKELEEKLKMNESKIQCIVSKNGYWDNSISFGEAQTPGIQDYADHVDTLEFLTHLK